MKSQKLRSGFTTGTCAAAAAHGAAFILMTGRIPDSVTITTPKGTMARLIIWDGRRYPDRGMCSVKKDAGDDPDVTDGALISAEARFMRPGEKPSKDWYTSEEQPGIWLAGGAGVGTVTLPGLACPVGMPAINPIPRKMIFEAAAEVLCGAEKERPVLVTVHISHGQALAEKTFNPRLGIVGGISVLGTTGVVEPMSEEALAATIGLEFHMRAVAGRRTAVMAPGNYGLTFLKEQFQIPEEKVVVCSNFAGDGVEMAAAEGIRELLFAGHIGKLIKIAGGVRNTHSRYGDGRMEILTGFLDELGKISLETRERVSGSNTTEEAVDYLVECGLIHPVAQRAAESVKRYMELWGKGRIRVETILFSSNHGILSMTGKAGELAQKIRREIEETSLRQRMERNECQESFMESEWDRGTRN